ncbi:hypothetical protein LAZ67_7000258 [Cordylochernes scorpioides]|uniref:Transposase n=1 Tax=Cordylochernes scorpioides TaxID=51811 RepID=A0ABY6KPD5_9ARAC|nr:hypothetical protein LAZ67_7000258 [Cordylochernes scorpioides]
MHIYWIEIHQRTKGTRAYTFKEDALSQSRTFEWFSRFKAGRTSVKDDLHTGRPLPIRNPENVLKIKSSNKGNPRITIRELSEDLDISFGTCQTIIKNDLHLKRSPAKFVPHLLTNEQKEHCKETCKNMVEMFNSDPHWLKYFITGDETWGLVHYEFVPEGQTINHHYYLDVLRRLREAVRQKRPENWHQKNWPLHHDNARPHTAVTVQL